MLTNFIMNNNLKEIVINVFVKYFA